MRHGTQEELDAAKEDAMLLPFGAQYQLNISSWTVDLLKSFGYKLGDIIHRQKGPLDSNTSVGFIKPDSDVEIFVDAGDLEPIK